MKRKYIIGLMLIMVLTLCGCGCKHEWSEATCESPRTCANCDAVEGEALGHDWVEASCESPRTCARCGLTEGEALGHDWLEATCESPKTCARCDLSEGEALGHDWLITSCTEPRSCTRCQLVDEEISQHRYSVWRVKDDSMSRKCSLCGHREEANFDKERVINDGLKGQWILSSQMGFAGGLQASSTSVYEKNNPGCYIDFDAEGKGTLYQAAEINGSSPDAADAYAFEATPLQALYSDYEFRFLSQSYTFSLRDESGTNMDAMLSTAGVLTISDPDTGIMSTFNRLDTERMIFAGDWLCKDGESKLSFLSDGSFSANVSGNELHGTYHLRPRILTKLTGGSLFSCCLHYEHNGSMLTDYLEISLYYEIKEEPVVYEGDEAIAGLFSSMFDIFSEDYEAEEDTGFTVIADGIEYSENDFFEKRSKESISMNASILGENMVFEKVPASK